MHGVQYYQKVHTHARAHRPSNEWSDYQRWKPPVALWLNKGGPCLWTEGNIIPPKRGYSYHANNRHKNVQRYTIRMHIKRSNSMQLFGNVNAIGWLKCNLKFTPLRNFPSYWVQITNARYCTHVSAYSWLLSFKHHPESHAQRNLGVHCFIILGKGNDKLWRTCSIK